MTWSYDVRIKPLGCRNERGGSARCTGGGVCSKCTKYYVSALYDVMHAPLTVIWSRFRLSYLSMSLLNGSDLLVGACALDSSSAACSRVSPTCRKQVQKHQFSRRYSFAFVFIYFGLNVSAAHKSFSNFLVQFMMPSRNVLKHIWIFFTRQV